MARVPGTFPRFLMVGVLNTAVGYAIYAAGVLAGLSPQVALALQFVLGPLWNYATHGRLVFGNAGIGRLPLYLAAYALIWAANALALRGLLILGLGPLWAQLAILPATTVLSYLLISRVLSSDRRTA